MTITNRQIEERRLQKNRERKAEYRKKHRDEINAYQRAWKARFKEEHGGISYDVYMGRRRAERELFLESEH